MMMEGTLIDILWLILAASLVFIMQAGFAMLESGLTRSKNSINVAIKNLTDLGVSILVFWILGFALMFGTSVSGLFGSSHFLFEPQGVWGAAFFLFQAMFCSTSATIVSGAVAERMRYSSYILSTVFLSLAVYPIFGHWAWGGAFGGEKGWLASLGFVDFAGSTVVHSLGGWVGLAILVIIGPRSGRFGEKGEVREINGSDIPIAVLGVILLWFGWFGFNGGSTLSMNDAVPGIILRTTLSAAAAMVGTLVLGWIFKGRADVSLVMNGALAGLVAITAPVHAVTSLDSVFIGLIGGMVMLLCDALLVKLRIDDAVGAIPVHLAAGIWGTLAVALFGDLELLGTGLNRGRQFLVQLLGITSCGAFSFGSSFIFLFLVNKVDGLRVSPKAEHDGLNRAEHGVSTELIDLFVTMEEQTKTGNLKLRAPVEPFTEVGQIAVMYNQVMESLEKNTIERGEYVHILQNMGDGLFLLDKDRSIGSYYASALETILNRKDLGGLTLESLMASYLDDSQSSALKDFLDLAFDPSISWRTCERLNPIQELHIFVDNVENGPVQRFLRFDFKRIHEDRGIKRLLVLVRDETEQKLLSQEVEQARRESRTEMELLYRIMHVEPGLLMAFMKDLKFEMEAINEGFRAETLSYRTRLEDTFRHSHTIKGDAELLRLDFIAEKVEELEAKIQELLARDSIEGEDILPLTLIYSELQRTVENVEALLVKWRDFGRLYSENSSFASSARRMVERYAGEYGKRIVLHMEEGVVEQFDESKRKKVKDIIIQLLRNSIYHGIEMPKLRVESGKNEEGIISIQSCRRNGTAMITFKDDGGGLDLKALWRKGIEKGLITETMAEVSKEKLMEILFAPGVSTASTPDTIAGKGVGMGLVKRLIKDLDGTLGVNSKRGEGCTFTVSIPMGIEN